VLSRLFGRQPKDSSARDAPPFVSCWMKATRIRNCATNWPRGFRARFHERPDHDQLLSKAVGASNELALAMVVFLGRQDLPGSDRAVVRHRSGPVSHLVHPHRDRALVPAQALGTPQLPPNQVLIGCRSFSHFHHGTTVRRVHEQALQPLMDDKISVGEALQRPRTA